MPPSQPIRVRRASPADLDCIVEFNAAMAVETEGKSLDRDLLRQGVDRALIDPARCTYFVAESAGRVVGQTMFTLEWSDWRNAWFWWIQSVYVLPEFRGRGVFQALYEHIRHEARRRDVCGIRLYVHDTNHRAMQVYENVGMTLSPYRVYEEAWSTGKEVD
jgi:GNAT superfamily N-acetyltransferase